MTRCDALTPCYYCGKMCLSFAGAPDVQGRADDEFLAKLAALPQYERQLAEAAQDVARLLLRVATLERQLTEERASMNRFETMLDEANAEGEALERQLAEAREVIESLLLLADEILPAGATFNEFHIAREWLKANGGAS
jgi:septal ring factor EnvC (AmiA/AmiB activator)